MWFSPIFREQAPYDFTCLHQQSQTESYSHDNIFHTLLPLMDINTRVYQKELDVLAKCHQDPTKRP